MFSFLLYTRDKEGGIFMKIENYEIVTRKSIMEIKQYILAIAPKRLELEIGDIINHSIDQYELKKRIHKNPEVELALFVEIKTLLDQSTHYDVFQQHLIYFNILFSNHFKPMKLYQYKLFQYILSTQEFNLETYCLLRHLVQFKPSILPDFLMYICQKKKMNDNQTNLLICQILCLEHAYQYVYDYLKYVDINDLGRFQKGLYYYSPYKYHRLIRKRKKLYQVAFLN